MTMFKLLQGFSLWFSLVLTVIPSRRKQLAALYEGLCAKAATLIGVDFNKLIIHT